MKIPSHERILSYFTKSTANIYYRPCAAMTQSLFNQSFRIYDNNRVRYQSRLKKFPEWTKKQKLVIRKNDFMALTEITESLGTFLWKVFAKATDRHLKVTFSLICWRIPSNVVTLWGKTCLDDKFVTATIGTFLLPCFILQFFWRTFVHGPFEVKELFLSTNVPLSWTNIKLITRDCLTKRKKDNFFISSK